MAFCPSCGKEMSQLDTICPHCDYDFPAGGASSGRLPPLNSASVRDGGGGQLRPRFIYSNAAELFLMVVQFLYGLGAVVGMLMIILHLVTLDFSLFIYSVVSFIAAVAGYIVIARVRDLSADRVGLD